MVKFETILWLQPLQLYLFLIICEYIFFDARALIVMSELGSFLELSFKEEFLHDSPNALKVLLEAYEEKRFTIK